MVSKRALFFIDFYFYNTKKNTQKNKYTCLARLLFKWIKFHLNINKCNSECMQKLGIKDSLPGLLAMPFFSVLRCLRSSSVLLYCLPLSPFFSLFSSLLFPFFSVLLSFSWKLALRRMKTTGADSWRAKMMMLQFLRMTRYHWFWRQWRTLVTLVLVSVFLFLPMLSLEMAKTMMMKACCAGGVVALASMFFLAFDSILLMAFSALPLSRFFLSFFSRFSLFSPFFFCFSPLFALSLCVSAPLL